MKASMIAAACFIASASAFAPPQLKAPATRSSALQMGVLDDAMTKFSKDFPLFSKAGWGPSTKAERWNGRHAMFGWVAILLTGYAKSHGLIPDAESALNLSDWGTLSIISGTATITNERAVILAAHIHALTVSLAATLAPLSFQDKLFLGKDEKDEPAAGLFVPLEPGLTKNAELLNGRIAMLGLIVTVAASFISGQSFLDTVDAGLGGLLL